MRGVPASHARQGGLALGLGQELRVLEPLACGWLGLGGGPQRPLQGLGLAGHVAGPECALAVALRQVQGDGQRFVEHQAVVVDDWHLAVGVHRQIGLLLELGRLVVQLDVFVGQAQLFDGPERADGTRGSNAIDFQSHSKQSF